MLLCEHSLVYRPAMGVQILAGLGVFLPGTPYPPDPDRSIDNPSTDIVHDAALFAAMWNTALPGTACQAGRGLFRRRAHEFRI